jgi:hypothetical protein
VSVEYLHALEGRLRVKVPEVKGVPTKAREIERQFGALRPIDRISANPVTGNVLIYYDARMTSTGEIVDALFAVGYLAARTSPASPSRPPAAVGVDWGGLALRATAEFALQKLITALI